MDTTQITKEIFAAKASVTDCQEKLLSLKESQKSVRDDVIFKIVSHMMTLSIGEVVEWSNKLYWTDFDTGMLVCSAYKRALRSPFVPLCRDFTLTCFKCQLPAVFRATSWKHYQKYSKPNKEFWCEPCSIVTAPVYARVKST